MSHVCNGMAKDAGVSERNYFDFSAVLFGLNGSLNKDLHWLQSLKFSETQMWTKFLFRYSSVEAPGIFSSYLFLL